MNNPLIPLDANRTALQVISAVLEAAHEFEFTVDENAYRVIRQLGLQGPGRAVRVGVAASSQLRRKPSAS